MEAIIKEYEMESENECVSIDSNQMVADCIRSIFMMEDDDQDDPKQNETSMLEKYYTEALSSDTTGNDIGNVLGSPKGTVYDKNDWNNVILTEFPETFTSSSECGSESTSESSDDAIYTMAPVSTVHLPLVNPSMYVLHTIMEESCEESDRESDTGEGELGDRHLPSELEKYFNLAFVSEQKNSENGLLKKDHQNSASMASSRLEKYFTSGLLEGTLDCYPKDESEDGEGNNESMGCHFDQENSDTVKRKKSQEIEFDPLIDIRKLYIEDGVEDENDSAVELMQSYSDEETSYMLNKLMSHIKSSDFYNEQSEMVTVMPEVTNSDANNLALYRPTLSLLETQISQLMQRVSPASFLLDDPSSTSSTCSSSTIGSTGNNSDCGSDTLESREDSTDEEGGILDADCFRISTPKRKIRLLHNRSHSKSSSELMAKNPESSSNISEETIYFCKQLVESLKRMSENTSPEGNLKTIERPDTLPLDAACCGNELTNARQYIKDQIESLMHTVTLSQQNSPAAERTTRPPRKRAEHGTCVSSSDAHDSSDLESPRPPNKQLNKNKTPSESGSETTVSASISIPSYDDSDHTPTESEISHEMDELFVLLEGSGNSSNVADYLSVPRIMSNDSKMSAIHVSMNGSKLPDEKKADALMDAIKELDSGPSTSKCLVNVDANGVNVFIQNVSCLPDKKLEDSTLFPHHSSAESNASSDWDCLTPTDEFLSNVSQIGYSDGSLATASLPIQLPILSSGQNSLSSADSKCSDSGSQETLVGSRIDLKESVNRSGGTRLFRSKRQHYSSMSEVDDDREEGPGRAEADSGVGTPVPNAFNSKEKASSENNLLLANYGKAPKNNKVSGVKTASKSASNIMELETSSEHKSGGSCRDTGYYSFKSSEESVRSFDDSIASRASSVSLVFHKSLTSTETIPEVEEDSCSLSGNGNNSPELSDQSGSHIGKSSSSKMSLSSGNIPEAVAVVTNKSSTLPLNLRNKPHLATSSLNSSHTRQRPISSSFFSTSGVLRKLSALRDENALANRSSPRGRLRARGKALSSSSDDGINRVSTSSVPQILVSDHVEISSVRGSLSMSDRDSIGVSEEDVEQGFNSHSRSQISLFGTRSESMSSVYSAAGGGRYGAVTVTGEILFSLMYNCKASNLVVHVKECRNLASVDIKRNRSDPYVKVYLLPDKTKSGKRKTKVRKHTLNPVFDETLKFSVTNTELNARTMWLSVWHSDIFGRNDFLGEVMLPLSAKIIDIPQALQWYPLQERLDSTESSLSYKGDIILALKFVPPDVTSKKSSRKGTNSGSSMSLNTSAGTKGALHVLVKEARNLMATRSNGTSDPFCKCYLLPDKSKSGKQKTSVAKKSCNPKWNHTFVYEDFSTDELKDRCLELTIWDYDKITSNDFLGGVRMNLGTGKHQGRDVDWMDAIGEELVLWRSMVDRPNQWIDAALMLRPTLSRRL